jgi:hypothetical protein
MMTRSPGEVVLPVEAGLALLPEAFEAKAPEDACARQMMDRKLRVKRMRTAVLMTTRTSLGKVAGLSSQEHKLALEQTLSRKKEKPNPETLNCLIIDSRSFDSKGRLGVSLGVKPDRNYMR